MLYLFLSLAAVDVIVLDGGLCRHYGPDLTWYVPLGLKPWFISLGIRNVIELDWWQEVQHAGSKVSRSSCRHHGDCSHP